MQRGSKITFDFDPRVLSTYDNMNFNGFTPCAGFTPLKINRKTPTVHIF